LSSIFTLDKKIALVILEAYERDVGRGLARIDSEVMKSIEASSNDLVELIGRRRTAAKLLQLYPSDEKTNMIRIDGLTRNNVGANIGDRITIRKISSQRAEKVTVTALEPVPAIDERYLGDALEAVPVTIGDNIMVPYFGVHLTFEVVDTKPDSVVVIDQKTIFSISNKGPGLIPTVFMYSSIESLAISHLIGFEIEDSIRQEDKEIFLVLRIRLTCGEFLASGEFQKKMEKGADMRQIFSRYKEMADQEIHSENNKLLNPTEYKESQFEMLQRVKFNILERWGHAF